jgi:hypothetical protein
MLQATVIIAIILMEGSLHCGKGPAPSEILCSWAATSRHTVLGVCVVGTFNPAGWQQCKRLHHKQVVYTAGMCKYACFFTFIICCARQVFWFGQTTQGKKSRPLTPLLVLPHSCATNHSAHEQGTTGRTLQPCQELITYC